MQWSEFGAAVSDLSQALAQAIVLPFRRGGQRPRRMRRAVPRTGGPARELPLRVRGHLVLAAGSLPDEVVVETIHLAGGRRAAAVVVPAAYGFPGAGERYRRYLLRFGMERAVTLDLSTQRRAESAETAAALAAADLVLLGGGSPELLVEVLSGTPAGAALPAALARGAVVIFAGPAVEAAGEWWLTAAGGATGTPPGRPGTATPADASALGPGPGATGAAADRGPRRTSGEAPAPPSVGPVPPVTAAGEPQAADRAAAGPPAGPPGPGDGKPLWVTGAAGEAGRGVPPYGRSAARPGLGLLPGTVVTAAPTAGGRLTRTFAMALSGGVQALLLDDGAVLLVRPGWRGEVRAGAVLALGGTGPAGEMPPLGGVYTRLAPSGWRLDLAAHLVLPPGQQRGAERP